MLNCVFLRFIILDYRKIDADADILMGFKGMNINLNRIYKI